LAVQEWTTYQLAQQMERSLSHFWPRAQSRIYEEPKRLAALGLATAERVAHGRRESTRYRITPKGRRSLARWLDRPGAGPVVEFEALLKVFFSDQSSRAAAAANVEAIRSWAQSEAERNVGFARLYTESGGPFPDRLAQITLIGKFLTDFADMVEAWAQWAQSEIARWPDSAVSSPPAWDVLEQIAERSTRIASGSASESPSLPLRRST
jgi:DNA-binding PadR family transcriptional regulator